MPIDGSQTQYSKVCSSIQKKADVFMNGFKWCGLNRGFVVTVNTNACTSLRSYAFIRVSLKSKQNIPAM